MVHIQQDFPECKPFGHYAKRAIIELIRNADKAERDGWIRVALDAGAITQADAEGLR